MKEGQLGHLAKIVLFFFNLEIKEKDLSNII